MLSMSSVSPLILSAIKSSAPSLGTKFTQVSSNRIKSDNGNEYFTKLGSGFDQMKGEAESLKAMAKAAPGLAPNVYVCEPTEDGSKAVMVSDYFPLSSFRGSSSQSKLAERLAQMHDPKDSRSPTGKYGFGVPTHCGVTEQDNTWTEEWMEFYRDRRVGDLISRINKDSRDPELVKLGEELKTRVIPLLLTSFTPAPQPVIIHGDLWSGNVAVNSQTGEPVIYDPSSYYGHHEVELGIMHMFGGFGSDFFEAYHSIRERSQPHYDERIKLYELYHHLNHYLIFGGGYRSGAIGIMKDLISFTDRQEKQKERANI